MKQMIGRIPSVGIYVAFVVSGFAVQASAQSVYVTNFTKNNSIYSNLNQEYPHTGTGTPGSGVSTPNASFFFNPAPAAVQAAGYAPDYVAGSNLANNGVGFMLTSDALGHDFEQIDGGTTLAIPINLSRVTTVYALMSAYNGVSFNATFTGANGATQTFSNVFLPDFNGGGSVNGPSGGATTQTLFQVHDVGAGGTGNSSNGAYNFYNLTEVAFTLSPALSGQTLASASFTSNGYETLLLGVTAVVPEPGTWALLVGAAMVMLAGVVVRRRQRTI